MLDILRDESSHRTAFDALPARDTNRFLEGLITKGADLEVVTPVGHVNGVYTHNLPARSDTYATLDTLVGVEIEEGIACIYRKILGHAT